MTKKYDGTEYHQGDILYAIQNGNPPILFDNTEYVVDRWDADRNMYVLHLTIGGTYFAWNPNRWILKQAYGSINTSKEVNRLAHDHAINDPQTKCPCSCSARELFNYGCKCGAIKAYDSGWCK